MSTATDPWWRHTLIHHLWQRARHHWRFQVSLPRMREIELRGIRIDVSRLSRVMRNILLDDRYEASECELASRHLDASDQVLELGGAIGFVALHCQKNLGIRRYAVVEANPGTVELLRRNFELNGLTPEVLTLALAPTPGPVSLGIGTEFWENSLMGAGDSDRTTVVEGCPFVPLLARIGFEPTALIIDVEGAERYIDPADIPASVTKVILELHRQLLGVETAYSILAGFLQAGFRVEEELYDVFHLRR